MGGLYITTTEREIIGEVLAETRDWLHLPHRILETAAFFVTLARKRDRLAEEETFNICRFSLGLRGVEDEGDVDSFYHSFREDDGSHPIMQLLGFLYKEATIKTEQFIIDNCFTLPYCTEHEVCKLLHSNMKGSGKLCCCDKNTCKAFTNFHMRRAKEDPEVPIVETVTLLN